MDNLFKKNGEDTSEYCKRINVFIWFFDDFKSN